MTPEGRVKKACRVFLRDKGCYIFSPVQTGYGAPTLDDLVCWRGRFLAIEYKALGKAMTPRQRQTELAITAAGGTTFTICALSELIEIFEMLELRLPVQRSLVVV